MDQPLTRIQLEIVVHIANGLRPAEIAEIVHRSESSVKKVLATAQRSAGAKTLPHLVSIVIASGILTWTPDGGRVLQEEPASVPTPPAGGSSSIDSPPCAA